MNEECPLCKNVFLGGTETPSKELFTQLWVQLINEIEEEKDIVTSSP